MEANVPTLSQTAPTAIDLLNLLEVIETMIDLRIQLA